MRVQSNVRSVSNPPNNLKFSQKVDLNSSNVKNSRMGQNLMQIEHQKSVISSSKISSNISSEASKSEMLASELEDRDLSKKSKTAKM